MHCTFSKSSGGEGKGESDPLDKFSCFKNYKIHVH